MNRDLIKIDVCANWLTSGINFNKFFVVLHSEKQCMFSFVETRCKSIIAFYCSSKFTWCFHKLISGTFFVTKSKSSTYRESFGPCNFLSKDPKCYTKTFCKTIETLLLMVSSSLSQSLDVQVHSVVTFAVNRWGNKSSHLHE